MNGNNTTEAAINSLDQTLGADSKQAALPSPESGLRSYYSARALEYDRVYQKPERQADLRAIEKWLPAHFAGASVLEIACGTGYWTQFIAPVARALLGIDSSEETLALARQRLSAETIQFQVHDAYCLSRLGRRFDAMFAGFWFSHVPTQRQREFLAQLHGVLQPGAKVVFLDNRFVQGNSTPISDQDAEGNTFQTRLLENGSQHRILKNYPTESEFAALLSGTGSQIRYTTWPYYWALEYSLTRNLSAISD